ncbi:MAG: TrmH family RNA methyltransferase [Flavobacteriales bacterium]
MEKISLQKIKWIKSLHLKKNREKEKLILVEGEKLVKELMEQYPSLIHTFVTTEVAVSNLPEERGYYCAPAEMDRISQFTTSSCLMGIFHIPETPAFNPSERILVLESIQDPGNLGTIIRTADWFGIKQIVCSEDTVHHLNSKVIQASMGSAFRIAVFYKNLVEFLPNLGLPIHGALLNGKNLSEISPAEIKILVMGNEGKGISEKLQEHISQAVTIPGYGHAESLNVSMATGIFLYHWSQSKLN